MKVFIRVEKWLCSMPSHRYAMNFQCCIYRAVQSKRIIPVFNSKETYLRAGIVPLPPRSAGGRTSAAGSSAWASCTAGRRGVKDLRVI